MLRKSDIYMYEGCRKINGGKEEKRNVKMLKNYKEESKMGKRCKGVLLSVVLIFTLFLFFGVSVAQAAYEDYLPVSHWNLDDGSGLTADDCEGSNNGTLDDLTHISWVTGNVGDYALEFDGTGSVVNCGDDSSLNITGAKSIALWIYKPSLAGNQPWAKFVSQGSASGKAYCVGFGTNGDGTDLELQFGTARFNASLTDEIPDDAWTHICGTYNGSTLKVYINGREQTTTASGTASVGNTDFAIGARYDGGTPFEGKIDDVYVWDYMVQGKWFVHPTYEISLEGSPQPKSGPDWYRGKALAVRLTWNLYIHDEGTHVCCFVPSNV